MDLETIAVIIGIIAGAIAIATAVFAVFAYFRRKGRGDTPTGDSPSATPGGPTATASEGSTIIQDSSVTIISGDVQAPSQTDRPETVRKGGRTPPSKDEIAKITSSWTGRPAPESVSFFGRDNEIPEIGKYFVIAGGAGAGKSRLAAEWSEYSGRPGLWTNGRESADSTLAGIAERLGIDISGKTDDKIAVEVVPLLGELPDDAVWIVDDLPDLSQVSELLARTGKLRLVVTSRDSNFNVLSPGLGRRRLDPIGPEPAVELLTSRGGAGEEKQLKEIALAVGYLPFALEILAVRLGQSIVSASDVLAEFEVNPNPIEIETFRKDFVGVGVTESKAVYSTIVGSILAIDESARDALLPLSFLADAPIPEPLVLAVLQFDDRSQLIEIFEQWERQSLVSSTDGRVRIHALTQAALRSLAPAGQLEATARGVGIRIAMIGDNDPVTTRSELLHCEVVLDRLRRQYETDMPVAALGFIANLGNWFEVVGRYDDALRLQEEVVEQSERILGEEHPDTISTRSNLAVTYSGLGRHEDALRLKEVVVEQSERILGEEHPDTITARGNLANSYFYLGRHEDALHLGEVVLEQRERILGEEHPDTVITRGNLANSYSNLGRHDDALRLQEEVVEQSERILGEEHPDTISSRVNLAVTYSALGRHDDALLLNEKVLEQSERILGGEHPDTISTRNNLAATYSVLGRHDDAFRLEEEVLEQREYILGEDHPDTISAQINLAVTYSLLGRHEDALHLEEVALEQSERILGEEHPDTIRARSNLVISYSALGREEEAQKLRKRIPEK